MLKFNGKDPMGKILWDYHHGNKNAEIEVFSNLAEPDVITGKHLFRSYTDMPELEQKALVYAKGKILDVGAASGCHSLFLLENKQDVSAIDISPGAVAWLQYSGIKAQQANFFKFSSTQQYDTILMLMNGIGICGEIFELGNFFLKVDSLLKPGGQLIFDSSDLQYIFQDADEEMIKKLSTNYYGEVVYEMKFQDQKSGKFPWLFIDYTTLQEWAVSFGFDCELLEVGEHFDYLARLIKK